MHNDRRVRCVCRADALNECVPRVRYPPKLGRKHAAHHRHIVYTYAQPYHVRTVCVCIHIFFLLLLKHEDKFCRRWLRSHMNHVSGIGYC